MGQARTIENYSVVLMQGKWVASIKILQIPCNKRFPEGIKLSCVLLDIEKNIARLVLDNHAPYGYHFHPRLPQDSSYRVKITIADHVEAVEVFFRHAERIIRES